MKKQSTIILWCLLAILSGCTTAQFDKHHSSDSSPEPKLSLDEAKAAFEETYSIALTKSGSGNGHRNKLSPGEFTPLWDNAAYSENPKACSYDVKLITERKVYAIVAEFRKGKSVAEKVQVHQRLVTIKNESYPRTCCYILSLIPDYGCDGGDRMEERFRCCSDKGLFSGLAVYSALGSSAILRIDRYRNGTRLDGVYIPAGNGSKESRLEKAASMLRGITLINRRSVTTKSFGEDFWDDDDEWDYGDPEDYTDIGGGFYQDDDGDLFIDTDGDGMPDSMFIIGGGIYEDTDKDDTALDDPYWMWNQDLNDDGGGYYGGQPGTKPQPGKDKDTLIILDTIRKMPADLSRYYGTKEFYRERALDFKRRHPGIEPPSYYMEYGYEYCKRFNESTRQRLSYMGQIWCDNVTVALQKEVDFIIMNFPEIELFPDLLRHQAFQSHVNAYIDSGILELDIRDKLLIFLTVDMKELLTYDSTKQIRAVMLQQTIHYATHTSSAYRDSDFIIHNLDWIMTEIREYVNRNRGSDTKSSSINAEQEIFDLIFGQLIDYYEKNIPGFSLPENN